MTSYVSRGKNSPTTTRERFNSGSPVGTITEMEPLNSTRAGNVSNHVLANGGCHPGLDSPTLVRFTYNQIGDMEKEPIRYGYLGNG